MNALAARHREVLWLVGHDKLSPAEAAGVLGVNAGVFRVRLSRARQALGHALHDPRPAQIPRPDFSQEVPR